MVLESDTVIRNARLEDLPEIVAIYNSTIPSRRATADTEEVSVESRRRWFEEHSEDFRPLWVAEQNNRITGWLSFQSFYGRPAYSKTAELSIYIREECRNKGLGGTLLEKAIYECPRLGIKTLVGFIFGHNTQSLRLVTGYGFKQWGFMPGVAELDGTERDLIIVGRKIE